MTLIAEGPRGKKPQRPYSYNEGTDEAPRLIDEAPVDVEESTPADERRSEETVAPVRKEPPVFEE